MSSFFFFKQKTAYEMRISDWSSDVCSSDLRFGNAAVEPMAFGVHANGRCLLTLAADIDGARWIPSNQNRNELRRDAGLVAKMLDRRRDKIGRAACRERVCQYG